MIESPSLLDAGYSKKSSSLKGKSKMFSIYHLVTYDNICIPNVIICSHKVISNKPDFLHAYISYHEFLLEPNWNSGQWTT